MVKHPIAQRAYPIPAQIQKIITGTRAVLILSIPLILSKQGVLGLSKPD